ncbi:LmbE family protein [Actibacterium mucosum KCTC 23349]|uniref:LmbE family protein n=1 Tax=Actibacterium mucosum KCTC 23349 TaxID=1454373 RepID=A0A037ZGV5_9RHOB|nr:PIG-L family deacetylase [Actibacterium mucosum]KAJ55353.1 LmbE family protein [Actibacterium mucosum KCTC 23349]
MPLTAPDRIAEQRRQPRLIQLWFALQPLKSTLRFLHSGAHPDDEISGLMAALTFRDGISTAYVCSTRGEGGQNDIGTEATEVLGALRTAEMERACDVLDMRMYWLGDGPDDPIFDFGFSKSGDETLGYWQSDHTLARFVQVVRTEKPDILCPTFLDVPGQHGHHRAMTQMAHRVMSAAADPGFDSNLPPWQIGKLYLPAFSGAGQTYDDDLPPPPATLTIPGQTPDPVTGWSYDQIGQHSRAYHRTQAMGHWVPAGAERDWPLHLAESHVAGPDLDLTSGLPATLRAFADAAGPDLGAKLTAAQDALDFAATDFPNTDAILRHATEALRLIREVTAACPDALAPQLMHRLSLKERQLARVLYLASSAEVRARTDKRWLTPGDTADVTLETRDGTTDALTTRLDLPAGWEQSGPHTLATTAQAAPRDGYRMTYDPLNPPAPRLRVDCAVNGVHATTLLPFEDPPAMLPARQADLSPDAQVLNLAQPNRDLSIQLQNQFPTDATPALTLPEGWTAEATGTGFDITAPPDLPAGIYTLPLTLGGHPAQTARPIAYPHIAPTLALAPAQLRVCAVDVALPRARVAYVGGGNDRVDHWLGAIGADVTALGDEDLAQPNPLAGFDTLVIGIFAIRFRPSLAVILPAIHEWVRAGGNLVTLYHRPWDNWHPDTTPPARLQVGQPSLRWRVTDQTAAVTHLIPDHPILTGPNPIGPADWEGWHKERGLYFASDWDAAYQPLLEMADPGEAPHRGALLAARIGAGQHVHCALILHHQMEKLTPGAFRLMANLITPPRP